MSKNGSLIASEILIVDDEEDIADLIAGILHDEGYTHPRAGDSESALRRSAPAARNWWCWHLAAGPKLDGIEILEPSGAKHPSCRCDDQRPWHHRDRGRSIRRALTILWKSRSRRTAY